MVSEYLFLVIFIQMLLTRAIFWHVFLFSNFFFSIGFNVKNFTVTLKLFSMKLV